MQFSKDGFDGDPVSSDGKSIKPLVVYRAYGSSSSRIGRFFFTPQIVGIPRMNWTADMLEMELNAALWGNDFRYLAKFRVHDDRAYEIGPIVHDNYQGIDSTAWGAGMPFVQYSYFRNKNLFYQVLIKDLTQQNWREYLDVIGDDIPINAGRFHRADGKGNC